MTIGISHVKFERRRSFRRTLLRISIAVLGGLLLSASLTGVETLRPFLTAFAAKFEMAGVVDAFSVRNWLIGLIKIANESVAEKIRDLHDAIPFLFALGLGSSLAFWKSKNFVETLYSHAFEEYDTRILTPIGKPKPFDPLRGAVGVSADAIALPFVNNGGTSRFSAFEALVAFINHETDRTAGWFVFRKPKEPFGWTIVLGRSGAGKSRLAVEVARHKGMRESYELRGKRGLPSWRSWVRVQVLGLPPSSSDPWDAGWLRPTVKSVVRNERDYQGYRDELAIARDPIWIDRFREWRPARPTVLILDDPRDEDAAQVIETLEGNMGFFAHPVRLIIVNQSVPDELMLQREGERWETHGRRDPMISPVVLDNEAGLFDEIDLRHILSPFVAKGVRWASRLYESGSLDRFLAATQGEPLLIEIGIEWLVSEQSVDGITRDKLIALRTDRVLRALQDVGIADDARLRAIALATLVSGGGTGPKHEIISAAQSPEISVDQLGLAFPAERVDFKTTIPPIRPEAVGDAFIDRIYARAEGDIPARLIQAGWRINPDAMLATALRFAGRDGAFAQALSTGPPADSSMPKRKVALAYARAALVLPKRTLQESDAGRRAFESRSPARKLIEALDTDDSFLLADELLALASSVEIDMPFMGSTWIDFFAVALSGSADQVLEEGPLDALIERLELAVVRHVDLNRSEESVASITSSLTRLYRGEGDDAERELSVRLRWYDREIDNPDSLVGRLLRTRLHGASVVAGALKRTEVPQAALHYLRLQNVVHMSGHSRAKSTGANMLEVEKIAMSFPQNRDIQFEAARSWRINAYALVYEPRRCRAAAERVEKIAAAFPADRRFQNEVLRAWIANVYANDGRTDKLRFILARIEAAATAFPTERHSCLAITHAVATLAHSLREDSVQCRAVAQNVEEIANLFLADVGIQNDRAHAWRVMSFALIHDPVGCQEAVARVEAIAKAFPMNRNFQYERAHAWRNLANASVHNPSACIAAVDRIEAIAKPFPIDQDLQHERVKGWSALADAYRDNPERCRAAVDRVANIAKAFPADVGVQYDLIHALRVLSHAERNDLSKCRFTIERLDAIANIFPIDRDTEFERAHAWRNLVSNLVAKSDECYAAVEKVEAIAKRFPTDPVFQNERALAWVFFSHSVINRPADCRKVIDRVENISRNFTTDEDIQYARAQAWGSLAYAVQEDPVQRGIAIDRVDQIASHYPGHQGLRDLSRRVHDIQTG